MAASSSQLSLPFLSQELRQLDPQPHKDLLEEVAGLPIVQPRPSSPRFLRKLTTCSSCSAVWSGLRPLVARNCLSGGAFVYFISLERKMATSGVELALAAERIPLWTPASNSILTFSRAAFFFKVNSTLLLVGGSLGSCLICWFPACNPCSSWHRVRVWMIGLLLEEGKLSSVVDFLLRDCKLIWPLGCRVNTWHYEM